MRHAAPPQPQLRLAAASANDFLNHSGQYTLEAKANAVLQMNELQRSKTYSALPASAAPQSISNFPTDVQLQVQMQLHTQEAAAMLMKTELLFDGLAASSAAAAVPRAVPSSTPPQPLLRSHSFNSKPTSSSAASHFPAADTPSVFDPATTTADLSPVYVPSTTAFIPPTTSTTAFIPPTTPTTAPIPPTTRQPRLASPRNTVFSGLRDAAVAAAPVFLASQPPAFFAAASEQVADVANTAVFDKIAAPSRRVGKDLQRIPSSTSVYVDVFARASALFNGRASGPQASGDDNAQHAASRPHRDLCDLKASQEKGAVSLCQFVAQPPPCSTGPSTMMDERMYSQPAGIIEKMQALDSRRVRSGALQRVVYNSLASAAASGSDDDADTLSGASAASCEPAEDAVLVFESRFESGNLRRATHVGKNEYDLVLQTDINTNGHTQWFLFRIENTVAGARYKFNIINMMKRDSLYNNGLMPLCHSSQAQQLEGKGWHRTSSDICYYPNNIRRKGCTISYYTLTFTFQAKYSHDSVYFAHSHPYTYTDLIRYCSEIEAQPQSSCRVRCRSLCQTLTGNSCPLLTVTSFTSDAQQLQLRKGIVITARVHPGETNASWMMKGIIDYLIGPSLDAKILRDNFVFKIVPMLNPDGVINGNYRCSLAGCDLNRQWNEPSRSIHPTIFYTKIMIKRLAEDRPVVLFADLHGHSRRKNIFLYGCSSKVGPQTMRERVFPKMLSRTCDFFSFDYCSFKVQKAKEGTGRVVLWRELGIMNSFTLEASLCGADIGTSACCHFNISHYLHLGFCFCDVILDYWDPDQSAFNSVLQEVLATGDFPEGGCGDSDSAEGSDDPDTRMSKKDKKLKKDKGSKAKFTRPSAPASAVASNNKSSAAAVVAAAAAAAVAAGGSTAAAKVAGKKTERKIEPVASIESKVAQKISKSSSFFQNRNFQLTAPSRKFFAPVSVPSDTGLSTSARFKIDPNYDLPPLLSRPPPSPAGKIIGLRSPIAASDLQHQEFGGGSRWMLNEAGAAVASGQYSAEKAMLVTASAPLSSQQQYLQRNSELPTISSHQTGRWLPHPLPHNLHPQAVVGHEGGGSAASAGDGVVEGGDGVPVLRRHNREMFDLGVSKVEHAMQRLEELLLRSRSVQFDPNGTSVRGQ